MPTPLPANPVVHTARLTVRLAERTDLPMLMAVNSDDTVTRFLPYPSWTGMADAQAWFDRMSARQDAGDAAQFAIVHKASGQVIGSCLLFRFDPGSARAEVGYVLGRAYWGAGYMFEAIQGLIGAAFGPWGLRRLEAEINPRNHASAKLLERLGFELEGRLRQRWVSKGEVYDACLYGLLNAQWPAPAVRMEPASA